MNINFQPDPTADADAQRARAKLAELQATTEALARCRVQLPEAEQNYVTSQGVHRLALSQAAMAHGTPKARQAEATVTKAEEAEAECARTVQRLKDKIAALTERRAALLAEVDAELPLLQQAQARQAQAALRALQPLVEEIARAFHRAMPLVEVAQMATDSPSAAEWLNESRLAPLMGQPGAASVVTRREVVIDGQRLPVLPANWKDNPELAEFYAAAVGPKAALQELRDALAADAKANEKPASARGYTLHRDHWPDAMGGSESPSLAGRMA